ncbi:MAG: hypothetical protein ABJJ03_07915 [Sulfitobacter sp.]
MSVGRISAMRRLMAFFLVALTALPVWAGARHTVLMDVLQIRQLSTILHHEGVSYGTSLDQDWLEGQGGNAWEQQVARIYDVERISEAIRAGVEPNLNGDALENVILFMGSDLGNKIVTLENSARTAMADPLIEEEARAQFAAAEGSEDARLAQIDRMIVVGDLVNRNTTAALNASYHFLRALVDGGFLEMSEEEMLTDVMSGRDEISADTVSWLGGFMLLAYSPLSLEELTLYADFTATPEGKALNAALFAGFDPLYDDISYALGRAIALNLSSQDL